jgi:hypothetical protein
MLALVAFAGILLVGYGLVSSRQAWSESSSKQLYQVSAQEVMYSSANDLRKFLATQLTTQATVDLSGAPWITSGVNLLNPNQAQGFVPYTFNSQAAGNISAMQFTNGLATLTDSNDPLTGIAATKTAFTYQQSASTTVSSPLTTSDTLRGWRKMGTSLAVEVRQFPLSHFTFFSSTNATISGSAGMSVGRIHSNGDLTITGAAQTDYPVTVSGSLAVGVGGILAVRQNPTASSQSLTSTTDVGTKRVLLKGLVADDATLASGTADAATVSGMALYSGTLAPIVAPHPVIEFDLDRLTTKGSTQAKYYISASDSSAVLILRNCVTLPRDISIVTPLDVWIDTGFNSPSDAALIRSASIITSGRVTGVGG